MSTDRRRRRCCEPEPEPERHNPPGLPAIEYRLRTQPESLERMIAELPRTRPASGPNRDTRPLADLRTRASDDPTIALLDAWACVLDVMSFYQERIANEGFLRTATERMSVLELARSIGYELDPGVAASALLAIEVSEAKDAPTSVEIPRGMPVMSVPGPKQRPQTFEVSADFVARREWNQLGLRLQQSQSLIGGVDSILVAPGVRIEPGAGVLAFESTSEGWDFALVEAVAGGGAAGFVELVLGRGRAGAFWAGESVEPDTLVLLGRTARVFGHRAPSWVKMHRGTRADLLGDVYDPESLPTDAALGGEWPEFALDDDAGALLIEGEDRRVRPGSWFVVRSPLGVARAAVEDVELGSVSNFAITSTTTELGYDSAAWPLNLASRSRREIVVYLESNRLELVDEPMVPALTTELELAHDHADMPALDPGQTLIISGVDEHGETQIELAVVRSYDAAGSHPIVRFETPLTRSFDPSSVRVLANVVPATHGETVQEEVLGSGDAALAFQRLGLRKTPMTHVSASTTSGSASTLELRVGGVLWSRLDTLFGQSPSREGYVERLADDGTVSVLFGDGVTGARLPTGVENVVARYRVGLGVDGMLDADSLRLAKVKPLGLEAITNPLPTEGGQDPERLADARANAPTTVSTLDRLVSVRDFEDFARSFAGISKARAVELWDREQRIVHLTVAGAGGLQVEPGSVLGRRLLRAIETIADPTQVVRLGRFVELRFAVELEVAVDPRYVSEDVHAAVAAALRETFAFDRRTFAQPVSAAEVITLAQGVAGVVAVDLNSLHVVAPIEHATSASAHPAALIPATDARIVSGVYEEAQLVLISDDSLAIEIGEMNT